MWGWVHNLNSQIFDSVVFGRKLHVMKYITIEITLNGLGVCEA